MLEKEEKYTKEEVRGTVVDGEPTTYCDCSECQCNHLCGDFKRDSGCTGPKYRRDTRMNKKPNKRPKFRPVGFVTKIRGPKVLKEDSWGLDALLNNKPKSPTTKSENSASGL